MRQEELTALIHRWQAGDEAARDEVFDRTWEVLHRLAARQLRKERPDHTLQPTALVNEAAVQLLRSAPATVHDRRHFVALAARVMRQVLVQHARRRGAARRPDPRRAMPLERASLDAASLRAGTVSLPRLLDLDRALDSLAGLAPRQARVAELRVFAGCTNQECGEILGVSEATAKRDWLGARLWLRRALDGGAEAARAP